MPPQIRCPGCNASFRHSHELRGKQVRCQKCKTLFRMPAEDEEVPLLEAAAPQTTDPNRLPIAVAVDPGPALQTSPDPPGDPEILPDMLPGHLREPTVSRPRRGNGLLVVGLVVGGLLCVGLGFGAAKLWLVPRDNSDGKVAENDDRDGQPPVGQPAMKPAPLEQDRVERKLPGPIRDLTVGGGGRFLVMHLPAQRQLAVFDASEAKVVRYLPAGGDHVRLAAGRDKLMVVLPDNNIIQRWDLRSGEREVSAALPFRGVVKAVAMGCDSQGPLLVHWAENTDALANAPVSFLDPLTLKTVEFAGQQMGRHRTYCYRDHMHFRASADGSVFGVWATSHSPSGLGSYVIEGNTLRHHYEHDSVGHIVPGPDGKHLFTGGGVYTAQLKRQGEGRGGGEFLVPAHHGLVHAGFRAGDRFDRFRPPGEQPPARGLSVYLGGDRPIITLQGVEVSAADERWATSDFTLDKRLHIVPAARLLVTIPAANDTLVLHRFDLDAALEKSGIDFLFVTSAPPSKAARNQSLRYQVAVRSKQGGVKYKLEAGPPGMKVSPSGLLTWDVAGDAAGEQSVILSVADNSKQEIFHTFKIKIE